MVYTIAIIINRTPAAASDESFHVGVVVAVAVLISSDDNIAVTAMVP